MRKLILWLVVIIMILSISIVYADVDLSGMSYDELVALKNKINLAMWNSEEWQEVTVPQGVWIVGEDIPVGTWTVKCADVSRDSYSLTDCDFQWGQYLSDNGQYIEWKGRYDVTNIYNPNNKYYKEGQITEYTFTAEAGYYVVIRDHGCPAVFSPYTGKPDLGFK